MEPKEKEIKELREKVLKWCPADKITWIVVVESDHNNEEASLLRTIYIEKCIFVLKQVAWFISKKKLNYCDH